MNDRVSCRPIRELTYSGGPTETGPDRCSRGEFALTLVASSDY